MSRTRRTVRVSSNWDHDMRPRRILEEPSPGELMLRKISVSDFRKLFIRHYRHDSQRDAACHFRAHLLAAVEHNHTELIAHLQVDLPLDLELTNEAPLLFAFRKSCVTHFEVFVPVGDLAHYEITDMKHVEYGGRQYGSLSAVEYACHLDGVDTISLLRFLVTFDEEEHRKRLLRKSEKDRLDSPFIEIEILPRTTVLHLVALLTGTLLNATRHLSLLTIVEAVMKAGACVTSRDGHGDTALGCIIEKVDHDIRHGIEIAARECRMILETVKLLVTAGYERDASLTGPFAILLYLASLYKPGDMMWLETSTRFTCYSIPTSLTTGVPTWTHIPASNLPLVVDLLDVLISHDPDCVASQIDHVTEVLFEILEHAGDVEHTVSSENVNDAMDDYANVFRCLANALANANHGQAFSFVDEIPASFLDAFCSIALFSVDRLDSNKLMRLVLIYLTAFQVELIGNILSGDDHNIDEQMRSASLAWIRGFQPASNLQNLVRRAMYLQGGFDFSICKTCPQIIKSYILFNADIRESHAVKKS